jgi:hypothetical protein
MIFVIVILIIDFIVIFLSFFFFIFSKKINTCFIDFFISNCFLIKLFFYYLIAFILPNLFSGFLPLFCLFYQHFNLSFIKIFHLFKSTWYHFLINLIHFVIFFNFFHLNLNLNNIMIFNQNFIILICLIYWFLFIIIKLFILIIYSF